MSGPIVRGISAVAPSPSVVSIGFFDGVHRGHQAIITQAVRRASDHQVRSVVVTFDRHPMEVVAPGSQPWLLQTLARRVQTLAEHVDLIVVLPFDDDLRHLTAEAFVEHVLLGPLQAEAVVVGRNFRFGHRASGDLDTLTDLGQARGFAAEGVDLLADDDGSAISSTEIRAAIGAGDVARAAGLLGRPHAVDGIVVRGDQRGHDLGFPTANLQIDPRVAVPAPGVYATMFHHPDGRALPAASSVGTNPTFGGQELRVEAFLLDVSEDLYGLEACLDFRARVRGEVRYESVDDLVVQMHDDVLTVRRLLGA